MNTSPSLLHSNALLDAHWKWNPEIKSYKLWNLIACGFFLNFFPWLEFRNT